MHDVLVHKETPPELKSDRVSKQNKQKQKQINDFSA
jgi:hypothetical protein